MADDQPVLTHNIETELTRRLEGLENLLNSDVITCVMPIHQPLDDLVRDAIEDIKPKAGIANGNPRNRCGSMRPPSGLRTYFGIITRNGCAFSCQTSRCLPGQF